MLQCFFSDETEAFRSPAEPGIFEWVTVRLRVEAGLEVQAALLVGKEPNFPRVFPADEASVQV